MIPFHEDEPDLILEGWTQLKPNVRVETETVNCAIFKKTTVKLPECIANRFIYFCFQSRRLGPDPRNNFPNTNVAREDWSSSGYLRWHGVEDLSRDIWNWWRSSSTGLLSTLLALFQMSFRKCRFCKCCSERCFVRRAHCQAFCILKGNMKCNTFHRWRLACIEKIYQNILESHKASQWAHLSFAYSRVIHLLLRPGHGRGDIRFVAKRQRMESKDCDIVVDFKQTHFRGVVAICLPRMSALSKNYKKQNIEQS